MTRNHPSATPDTFARRHLAGIRTGTGVRALATAVTLLLSAGATRASEVAVLLRDPTPAAGEAPIRDLEVRLLDGLTREGGLRPLDPALVSEAADHLGLEMQRALDRDEAVRLAEAVGADVLIYGSASVAGFEIDAQWVDARSGVASAESVRGPAGQVFDLIDGLGQRLGQALRSEGGETPVVAILSFQNRASAGSGLFVGGIPEMLMTNLRQTPGLALVDRALVLQGVAALSLQPGGPLSPEEAAAVGRWLGADVVIGGSFTDVVQLAVDGVVGSGGRPLGGAAAGARRPELNQAVDRLAADLGQLLKRQMRQTRTVAVLNFQNHSEAEYDSFVGGISDMLMTSLGQAQQLTIIERIQIERALRNFNLEMSGPIDANTAVEVGAWLGADAVVLGSFLRFGPVYRIDARLIDAATGEVVIAQSVRGPEDGVISMVDELGAKLVASFGARETRVQTGTGTLEIVFRTTKAEMGERPVYFHICKLYVDGSFLGLSPVVKRANQWVPLFRRSLSAGPHQVQVVHGYVRGDSWDGQMDLQPQGFAVEIEAGSTAAVKYSFEVGWFEDRYVYERSWPGAPQPADESRQVNGSGQPETRSPATARAAQRR